MAHWKLVTETEKTPNNFTVIDVGNDSVVLERSDGFRLSLKGRDPEINLEDIYGLLRIQ
jgi:hypothetical protein